MVYELSFAECESVTGAGPDWGQVGTGLGALAVSFGIAMTPVGRVGAFGAGLAAWVGGLMIGDGFYGGGIFNLDQGIGPFLPGQLDW
jgi:hypothetical protein